MENKQIKPIGVDAFKDGMLNQKRAQEIVDRLNVPWKVKMDGAPEAKVTMGTENNLINLTPVFGEMRLCLLVVNGGLRYGMIPIKLL